MQANYHCSNENANISMLTNLNWEEGRITLIFVRVFPLAIGTVVIKTFKVAQAPSL